MNRALLASLGMAAAIATNSVADAQLVRVGPFGGVNVRLPFTSVNVLPFGLGTQVRAPFTSVNTRAYAFGYGYRPPVYYDHHYHAPYHVVPIYHRVPVYRVPVYYERVYIPTYRYSHNAPLPSRADYQVARPIASQSAVVQTSFESVPVEQLPGRLRSAAVALQQSMAQRKDDSDVWLEYLAPKAIIDVVDSNASADQLADLLNNYEGVDGNGGLLAVQSAPGFHETHQLLRQFVGNAEFESGDHTVNSFTPSEDMSSLLTPVPDDSTDALLFEPTPASPVRSAEEPEKSTAQEPKPADDDKDSKRDIFEFEDELPAPRTAL
jgi:hypothetical protein